MADDIKRFSKHDASEVFREHQKGNHADGHTDMEHHETEHAAGQDNHPQPHKEQTGHDYHEE